MGQIVDVPGAICFSDVVELLLCSEKSVLGLIFLNIFQRMKIQMSNMQCSCSPPTDQGTASSG